MSERLTCGTSKNKLLLQKYECFQFLSCLFFVSGCVLCKQLTGGAFLSGKSLFAPLYFSFTESCTHMCTHTLHTHAHTCAMNTQQHAGTFTRAHNHMHLTLLCVPVIVSPGCVSLGTRPWMKFIIVMRLRIQVLYLFQQQQQNQNKKI